MNRLWLLCAVLAGCGNSNKGLLLKFNATDAAHVELFIANGSASSSSITPPDSTGLASGPRYSGAGWLIDPVIATADGNGSFQLKVSDADAGLQSQSPGNMIASLLVVEYDRSWTPTRYAILHDIVIPADDQETIVLDDLLHVAAISDTTSDGLQIWSRASDTEHKHASCAVVRDGGMLEFFSPSDDTDCDETSPDCAPFVFHNNSGPDPSHLSCAAPEPSMVCRLGGVGCVDGVGTTSTCTPSAGAPYCLPYDMCSTDAADPTCQTLGSTCFNTTLGKGSSTAIHCHVGTMMNGNACTGVVMASIQFAGVATTTCTSTKISADQPPLAFGSTAMIDGATVSIMATSSSTCTAMLSFTLPTNTDSFTSIGLIDFAGSNPTAHYVVPIDFSPAGSDVCGITCDPISVVAPHYLCQ